jgi:phage terminase small subunit
MCGFVATAREARRQLQGEPLTVLSSRGALAVNPLVRIERDFWLSFSKIASPYGMSPADRARIGLAATKGLTLASELDKRLVDDAPETIEIP